MSKYTKGRWIAVAGMVEVEKDEVADICSCYPSNFGQEHLERKADEIYANAKLIAAAPEMLDVLYAALPFIEDHEGSPVYKPGSVNKMRLRILNAIKSATDS